MEWLAIIGLALLAWWQSRRIDALTEQLAALSDAPPKAEVKAPTPEFAKAPTAPPPARDEEPLLLDTPLPRASNDDFPEEPQPLILAPPPPPAEPRPETPASPPPALAAPLLRPNRASARAFEQWLAEKGFAWLGGTLLALGGVFLVSVAVQQDWFTPLVQLVCALGFGFSLIAAGEWAKRAASRQGSTLVAAMLAGAGVVTLYATIWAAHALYTFIGPVEAGMAQAACALLLALLGLRHGEPLGVLAVALALLAPPLSSMGAWPAAALTLYVVCVGAAGFALAIWRRWPWPAAASALGLYFWFAASIVDQEPARALVLISLAAFGAVLLHLRPPLAEEPAAPFSWSRAQRMMPTATICISSVFALFIWVAVAIIPSGGVAAPAWVSAMLVALAAAAVRQRVAAPSTLAVAIAALPIGAMAHAQARTAFTLLEPAFYAFALFGSVVIAVAAHASRPHRNARVLIAAMGAIGAALLGILAATTRPGWHEPAAWIALFTTAALLLFIGRRAAAEVQDPATDPAVSYWAGASAVTLLLGVESLAPESIRTAAHAAAALVLAAGFAHLRWNILGYLALTAAALAIGRGLSPSLLSAPIWQALLTLSASAGLVWFASGVARRAQNAGLAREGLSSASVILVLIAGFTLLRWAASGGAGMSIDPYSEAALQALALIAAGYVLLPRANVETGIIGKWRGHVLLVLGLASAFLALAVWAQPWWGFEPAPVSGPPLFNALALAFGAPAALALAAARKLSKSEARRAAALYAGAGLVLGTIWMLSELRRWFHGPDMASAPVGLFEGAAYALLLLAIALAVTLAARRVGATQASHLREYGVRGIAWISVFGAAWLLLIVRHPWWGAHNGTLTGATETLLAVLAQAAAVVLALFLGRAISQSARAEKTRFAAAAGAALFAWSFGHSFIRWLHQRAAMDDGAPLLGLEGFAHALWPLAFVLIGSAATLRAPGRDTIRPYLYDLQAIWASAIWPTLVFAMLGLWLLFTPWWGLSPANMGSALNAFSAVGAFALAIGASQAAASIPHVRWPRWFERLRLFAAIGHAFVAVTLAVRWLFHADAMASAPITAGEMWSYSAAWALFAAGVFWLGGQRNNDILRRTGLALLVITVLKVVLIDTAQLSGLIRVGSVVGVAAVLLAIAWTARRNASPRPPPA